MIKTLFDLATSLLKSSGDAIAEKHRARSAILTSLVSGAGVLAIVFFTGGRLFLAELGFYVPANPDMFFVLNDFLLWILGALLGVSGGAGVLGSKRLINQAREDFHAHNKNLAEQKEKAQREQAVYENGYGEEVDLRLTVKRDYKKNFTIGQGIFEVRAKDKWRPHLAAPRLFFYELPQLFKGKENAVGKTCILEGSYLAHFADKSASGKFCEFGLYYLEGVPGRSGILIHRGWAGNNPSKYIQGCLMPCYGIDEKNRLVKPEEAMRDLVNALSRRSLIVRILS